MTEVVTSFYLMRNYFQAPWKIKDLITALLISAVLLLIFNFTFQYFRLDEMMKESSFKTAYTVMFFAVQWVIFLLPLLFVGPGYKKLDWQKFGFKKYSLLKSVGLILRGYFLYLLISFLIVLVVIYGDLRVPGYQVEWNIFNFFDDNLHSLIIAGVLVVIIGPILEELFFRGFLLRTLCDKAGLIFGSIVSAGLFAILHMPWQNIIPVFILGLIINSMVIKSKSLWPAIGFHIFNNAIAFVVQFLLFKEIISMETLV